MMSAFPGREADKPAAPAAFTVEATPTLLFRSWPPAVATFSGSLALATKPLAGG